LKRAPNTPRPGIERIGEPQTDAWLNDPGATHRPEKLTPHPASRRPQTAAGVHVGNLAPLTATLAVPSRRAIAGNFLPSILLPTFPLHFGLHFCLVLIWAGDTVPFVSPGQNRNGWGQGHTAMKRAQNAG
jgi:hypothetical protein